MSTPSIPRTFAAVIGNLRHGELADELTDALQELTQACAQTGRAGKLVFTLSLKPGKGRHFVVTDDIAVKKPKPEKGESLMFPTPDGFLTRDDPKQLRLDGLTVVERSGTDIIDVKVSSTASKAG